MKKSLGVRATFISDEFIDRYMPEANGEYVKVYLYLLRHQDRDVSEVEMADALNRTESDIRRAMVYWERLGVLPESEEEHTEEAPPSGAADEGDVQAAQADTGIPAQRTLYTPEQVKRLADDEDFSQLLYMAQKYMNKIFTPRECEVFAYLYDGLKLSAELLEYLVEYCVQGTHYSIRYMETVALDWHENGIRTVEAARQYTAAFSGEAFAVMKAFGLNDRRPADSEMKQIRKWFKEWGFSRELVIEACSRTINGIHKPSFAYANKILGDWKKAGVRVMADVNKLDREKEIRGSRAHKAQAAASGDGNRFHNFEKRDTNYDAIVMERLKERLGEQ